MDIAGIRIGMTEAEARAAIETFDADLEVTSVTAAFNYSDGVNLLQTPEFLDLLEGSKDNQGASIKVYFSGPVGDVRVIGVYRSAYLQDPPTLAQFVQGLVAKYGEPTGTSRANKNHLVWEIAGKPSCIRIRDGSNNVVLDAVPGTSLMVNSGVEQFFSQRSGNIMGKGLIPSDLTQCGAYLGYNYMASPAVRSFFAELYDLGAMVASERSRMAWVDQLQAEAVQKREGQGQTPRF